jgi:transcriptional regulator with PAS, ATPase and Fis domain
MPVKIATLSQVEKAHILEVLEYFNGDKSKAAKALGIGKTTLWRKLKEENKCHFPRLTQS